jgi:hypothetical protein
VLALDDLASWKANTPSFSVSLFVLVRKVLTAGLPESQHFDGLMGIVIKPHFSMHTRRHFGADSL